MLWKNGGKKKDQQNKNSRVIKAHENLDKVHVELKNAKINNFDS